MSGVVIPISLPTLFRQVVLSGILCCIAVSGLWAPLQAQGEYDPKLVLDTAMLIPRVWGVKEFVSYFPEKGAVIFTVDVLDKPLLQMEVRKTDGTFLYSNAMLEGTVSDTLEVEAHDRLRFRFRNGSFSFRYVRVILTHQKARPDAPKIYQDTLVMEVLGPPVVVDDYKVVQVFYDSLRLGSADLELDNSRLALAPYGEEGGGYRTIMKVEIPDYFEDQRVVGWSYWLGTGSGALVNFEENSFSLPDEWKEDGVKDLLHAYGRRLIPEIPSVNMGKKVRFTLMDDTLAAVAFLKKGEEGQDLGLRPVLCTYETLWLQDTDKGAPIDPKKSLTYIPYVFCLENFDIKGPLTVNVRVILLYEKLSVRERASRLENR